MNKYVRAAIYLSCGMIKMSWTKISHMKNFKGMLPCLISPFTEITLDYGGKLSIGHKFKMRDGAKIRVRKGAICIVGNNVSVNSSNIIACREKIIIGDNVQFAPNVQIYDHDHDFRVEGGLNAMKFKTSPIIIGDNVWVGANTTILRGTKIGNNCVIAAGCVLKGHFPDNSIIIQKREIKSIQIIAD